MGMTHPQQSKTEREIHHLQGWRRRERDGEGELVRPWRTVCIRQDVSLLPKGDGSFAFPVVNPKWLLPI